MIRVDATGAAPHQMQRQDDDDEAASAKGGEVHMPLEKQMWGDLFGQCADRFGVTWLVNIRSAGG